MNKTVTAAAIGLSLAFAAVAASAQPAAPAAANAKLSSDSTVKTLMGNAGSKAILEKNVPQIVAVLPQYEMLNDMSLKDVAAIPQAVDAGLTPDALKTIEAALAKL
jgi:hypothetical protein